MRSAAGRLVLAAVLAIVLAPATSARDEIERLKAQVRIQQEQIDELRKRLDAQQRLIESLLPPAPAAASASPQPTPTPANSAPVNGPLFIELGAVSIIPTGFIDFSQLWRSKTVTSGLPTSFGSVPFNNTVLGHRRQTISSAANTRLGFRMKTRVRRTDVLGLVETDFLGYIPNNVAITTNAYGL